MKFDLRSLCCSEVEQNSKYKTKVQNTFFFLVRHYTIHTSAASQVCIRKCIMHKSRVHIKVHSGHVSMLHPMCFQDEHFPSSTRTFCAFSFYFVPPFSILLSRCIRKLGANLLFLYLTDRYRCKDHIEYHQRHIQDQKILFLYSTIYYSISNGIRRLLMYSSLKMEKYYNYLMCVCSCCKIS